MEVVAVGWERLFLDDAAAIFSFPSDFSDDVVFCRKNLVDFRLVPANVVQAGDRGARKFLKSVKSVKF